MMKGILKIGLFSIAVLLMALGLDYGIDSPWIHPWLFGTIVFMWAIHTVIHIITELGKNHLEIEYHLLLLAGVSARLFIALFGLIFLSVFGIPNMKIFAANFSFVYLLFLVFEITTVLSNLRPNSSRHRP